MKGPFKMGLKENFSQAVKELTGSSRDDDRKRNTQYAGLKRAMDNDQPSLSDDSVTEGAGKPYYRSQDGQPSRNQARDGGRGYNDGYRPQNNGGYYGDNPSSDGYNGRNDRDYYNGRSYDGQRDGRDGYDNRGYNGQRDGREGYDNRGYDGQRDGRDGYDNRSYDGQREGRDGYDNRDYDGQREDRDGGSRDYNARRSDGRDGYNGQDYNNGDQRGNRDQNGERDSRSGRGYSDRQGGFSAQNRRDDGGYNAPRSDGNGYNGQQQGRDGGYGRDYGRGGQGYGGNTYPLGSQPTSQSRRSYSDAADTEITVISRNTMIDGNIRSLADMSIDGDIRGDVETTKDVELNGRIIGNMTCNNANMFASQVQGNVVLKGSVDIGRDTLLIGDLNSGYACINGKVKGNVDISGKAEFRADAVIFGDISASTITVDDGAIIQGYVSTTFLNKDESEKIFPESIEIGVE